MQILDMTDFFHYVWIIHLVRGLITFSIFQVLLKNKRNFFVSFLSLVPPLFVYSGVAVILTGQASKTVNVGIEIGIMAVYYILTYILSFIAYEGSWPSRLLTTAFSVIAYIVPNILSNTIISVAFSSVYTGLQYKITLIEFLSNTLITYAASFIFTLIIHLVKNRKNKETEMQNKYLFYLLFPLTHILAVLFIYYVIQKCSVETGYYFLSGKNEIIIFFIYSLCFISDFFIFSAVEHSEKIAMENIEYRRLATKNLIEYEQMRTMKKEKAEFRKVKHDLSNILTTVKGLVEINEVERAAKLLDNMTEDISMLSDTRYCSNETVNTIISIKKHYAEENGCRLNVTIEEENIIKIKDYDICRLISNILDNSINAATTAEDKSIDFRMFIKKDTVSVSCTNCYVENKKERKDDIRHGNGLKIINETVKSYAGKMHKKKQNGIFNLTVEMKNVA